MAKRNRKPKVELEVVEAPMIGEFEPEPKAAEVEADKLAELRVEAEVNETGDPEEKPINSVVAAKYKDKYIENAKANGVTHKAAKRSNWDWLSQQIASVCLNDKGKIRIDDFKALLDANSIDHSKWTNRNKGWEGRFRMTGRVALQRKVASEGTLRMPEFMSIREAAAPEAWVKLYKKD